MICIVKTGFNFYHRKKLGVNKQKFMVEVPGKKMKKADMSNVESLENQSADKALEISRRFAAVGVIVLLVVAGLLLAKQLAFSRIATADACVYYLPLAKTVCEDTIASGQHVIIPPAYPTLMGLVSRLLPFADDSQELAGQIISSVSVLGLVVCAFFIGRNLFNRRVGLAAAGLTAANPWIIHFGASVGPAMLYAIFLALMTLGLVAYIKRPVFKWVVCIVAFAALAALTRSEGIVFAPLTLLLIAVLHIRAARRISPGLLLHILTAIFVIAVIWYPRMLYMYEATGYYCLDARLLQRIPSIRMNMDISLWLGPSQLELVRLSAPVVDQVRQWGPVLKEAQETLLMVLGPATWVLAGVWLVFRKNLPRRGVAQIVLLAIILAQIVMVAPVKMDRRYVASVAALAQIWGGLGMVVIAERLRSWRGVAGKFGNSPAMQTVVLGFVVAALACWSVFKSNAGVRHHELRTLGTAVLAEHGPGKTFITTSSEVSYYAEGKLVCVQPAKRGGRTLSMEKLQEICQKHSVDFIVYRSKETWCPKLDEMISEGSLPDGTLLKKVSRDEIVLGKSSGRVSYLIDAVRLFE